MKKKSKRDFLETYQKVRKPLPRPEKTILNDKDVRKGERFDWREEVGKEEDLYDDWKY